MPNIHGGAKQAGIASKADSFITNPGLLLGLIVLCRLPAFAEQPRAVAGRIGAATSSATVCLDPLTRQPAALLTDPFNRLPPAGEVAVMQTVSEPLTNSGLPWLKVADAFPEFWAQPSIWRMFLRGPAPFSGYGVDIQARDWAGRMASDRRGYALDRGLVGLDEPSAFTARGPGRLNTSVGQTGLWLVWPGIAGRVYRVEQTLVLGQPFQPIQMVVLPQDGGVRLLVPWARSQGFYRVGEIVP